MSAEEDKSFKVSDRRTFGGGRKEGEAPAEEEKAKEPKTESAEGKAPGAPAGGPAEEAGAGGPEEHPPVDFTSFVLSLASSALIHLGAVPDPLSGEMHTDQLMARQVIDILAILREKTRGNLTSDEDKVLESILADLQMRYLKSVNFIG